jgi:hypothetical protein
MVEPGYRTPVGQYECENCRYCRMKGPGKWVIGRNERWLKLKEKARKGLKNMQD